MTILVVDDEPMYRLMTRGILMSSGHDVVLAESGDEGLKKLHSTPVDLIISDIYMPGMDGIRFHRAVRGIADFQKLPFLFVSGFDDRNTFEAIEDPKCDGFHRKGRPTSEMMEWITYLTAPESARGKTVHRPSRSKQQS